MRRLGELLDEGTDTEKTFADRLLRKLAIDGFIWNRTWRRGEDIWERTVQMFIDLGKPNPEVRAMVLLTAWMTGDPDPEGFGPIIDP
nr:hypothetical protein MFLOJ_24430 [Mycobacterium florentinum]